MSTPQYGAATGTDHGADINPLFPDTGIANWGSNLVSFTSEGNTLYGYYLKHTPTASKCILFCHGNVGNLDHFWPRAKVLYQTGADVFVFDYRGFGMSQGTPTEDGLKADAEVALALVTAPIGTGGLGYAAGNVVLYGYSLGSVFAVHLAAHGTGMSTAVGLFLEVPIGSTDIYVQDATGLPIPGGYVTKYRLDNITNIKSVYLPFLWLGGTADATNKYDTHGQAVFDNCPSATKYKKIVEGAGHGDVPYVMDPTYAAYITGVSRFISGLVPFP
jgi:pimeloyl-ACP methyl ester carboxylesterase